MIEAAFHAQWPKSVPKITYIVVNHNTDAPVYSKARNCRFAIPRCTYTTEEPASTATPRYFGIHNGLGLSEETLKEFTQRLNQNNQRNGGIGNTVLPVHYARALAGRMFDYFHTDARDTTRVNKDSMRRRINQGLTLLKLEKAQNEVKDHIAKKLENDNGILPWQKDLNDKMFYV
ncbi:hypothetical protein BU23DRAFT_575789 [Bimuria novae-zelandiae CBS 107.79]|uniref:Piwi domain-containing protein n=1 Tax=Bimuria novae-zelandiae CBS 107.79 TaxID=1447943 RepID=A0A6A5UIZ9_9PLEO|nr:hypothetical protein BU23DRAFT_575789 [Bimuria novae-zelandiae CBS 107.79]